MTDKTTIQISKSTLTKFNKVIIQMQAEQGVKITQEKALNKLMERYK